VPDVAFTNKWEATDPVRVVHLLEHTTGWDDVHPKEMAHDDPRPVTLAEGLAGQRRAAPCAAHLAGGRIGSARPVSLAQSGATRARAACRARPPHPGRAG